MSTAHLLATAAETPSAWTNLTFGMTLLTVTAAVALLSAVPVVIARRRRLRATSNIALAAVFWGILVTADIAYGINRTETDEARNDELLRTNYVDPGTIVPPPIWPWVMLGPAVIFYTGMVALAGTKPR